jgi:predicted O-linked N-acetylglucosamine transferase (SPINDLY family)
MSQHAVKLSMQYLNSGDLDRAEKTLRTLLQSDSRHAQGWCLLGLVRHAKGELNQAIDHYRKAARIDPRYADPHNNIGWACNQMRKPEEAVVSLRKALSLRPNFPEACNNLGNSYLLMNKPEEAQACFQKAVGLRRDFPEAHSNLGYSLLQRSRPGEALPHLQEAVRLRPAYPDALNNLGLAYLLLRRAGDAREALEQALRLRPAFPEALNNLGWALIELSQFERAVQVLQESLRLRPDYPDALNTLGWALIELGQFQQAVDLLQRALKVRPDFPDALNNIGLAYHQLNKLDEGLAAYKRALELRPDFAVAVGGIAEVYSALGWHEEAIPYHRRAVALEPGAKTYSNLLFNLHYAPDLSPDEVFREHVGWGRQHGGAPAPARPHANVRDPERRLRVGYVSADFARHVMGWYIEPVLEAHDRQRVETFCYADVKKPDDVTRHLQGLANHWRSIHRVPDEQAAEMIRQDQIDILVDLCNHCGGNRLPLFSHRPAPVQATHLGLQFTTGSPAIDYRITDPLCDPPGMTEAYNVERLVRLPEVSLCYRANVAVEVNELPANSTGHVTIGFFNKPSKITPPAIEAWGRIFRRLPGARLILVECPSPEANRRLLAALAAAGIGRERVTTVGRQSRQDYYRMYHKVDLTLDSFPYTGCFTTCDSLWMGVPLVTLEGKGSMARQGVSLLAHVGLNDLIAPTVDGYVETAVRLAEDRPRLAGMRATLRERLGRCTLMNPQQFTRQLEEAYRGMWREWCAR